METIKKPAAKLVHGNGNGVDDSSAVERLSVKKTYKLYIDGKFPRSESGRYVQLKNNGKTIANVCLSSRKDLRDSIVSNRNAFVAWSKRSAYNKGQIIYRIAETLEGRKAQFIETMMLQGYSKADAGKEVLEAIDLIVYYAGWSDKYMQVFSNVNPVEASYFNFSYPEPTGVIALIPATGNALISLAASAFPAITGGNTCTVIAAEKYPLTAIEFAEVLHASDLPPGVINILTGHRKELTGPASSHMDVNAFIYSDCRGEEAASIQTNAALNVKRIIDFSNEELQSPYRIMACQEIKTTWHPIGF